MSRRTGKRVTDQPSAFVAANGDRIEDLPNWDPVRRVVVMGGDRDALSAAPSVHRSGSTSREPRVATAVAGERRKPSKGNG